VATLSPAPGTVESIFFNTQGMYFWFDPDFLFIILLLHNYLFRCKVKQFIMNTKYFQYKNNNFRNNEGPDGKIILKTGIIQ